jgi:hypothetical protein
MQQSTCLGAWMRLTLMRLALQASKLARLSGWTSAPNGGDEALRVMSRLRGQDEYDSRVTTAAAHDRPARWLIVVARSQPSDSCHRSEM